MLTSLAMSDFVPLVVSFEILPHVASDTEALAPRFPSGRHERTTSESKRPFRIPGGSPLGKPIAPLYTPRP